MVSWAWSSGFWNLSLINGILFCTRQSLDITNVNSIEKHFDEIEPDVVINCAAYTNVELAESEADKAFEVNAMGAENLARYCKKREILLIHFSTDYVFDGTKNLPYTETDITSPINEYGKSKLTGEQKILAIHSTCFVIRISWLYEPLERIFIKQCCV